MAKKRRIGLLIGLIVLLILAFVFVVPQTALGGRADFTYSYFAFAEKDDNPIFTDNPFLIGIEPFKIDPLGECVSFSFRQSTGTLCDGGNIKVSDAISVTMRFRPR